MTLDQHHSLDVYTTNKSRPISTLIQRHGLTLDQRWSNVIWLTGNPLIFGVGFCWCNCNVTRPSAHTWPVRRSSWCGRHDCRASVPSSPSEPMLATTQHITHFSPGGKTTSNSSYPITINGEESADTNRRAQGRIPDLTCGSAAHIISTTDVAKIITWQPVSIINSTSILLVHPVRNQGAADPTASTIIVFPSSGCPFTPVMDCSLPGRGVSLGTECSNGSLSVGFPHEAKFVIMSTWSNGRISAGPSRGYTHFSTPECSNGWKPASCFWVINLHFVGPSRGHTHLSTPKCSNGWEPTSSSVVLNLHSACISFVRGSPSTSLVVEYTAFLSRPDHWPRLQPGY